MRSLLLAALLVTGCRPIYPAHELLMVAPDADLADHLEDFRLGIHGWDALGVRFRLVDELAGETPAAVIPVRRRPTPDGFRAFFNWQSGAIDYAPAFYDLEPRGSQAIRATIAHELGHAIGLDHVEDWRAVMHPSTVSYLLMPEDRAAFHAVWGSL